MLGPGLWQIMIAVGVVNIPIFARLLRGSIASTKENDYVLAAHSVGMSGRSILGNHILRPRSRQRDAPGDAREVPSRSSTSRASASSGSARGFLDARVGDDEHRDRELSPDRALTSPIIAGVTMVVTVLGFNLIGDGLREALDPKLEPLVLRLSVEDLASVFQDEESSSMNRISFEIAPGETLGIGKSS